MSETDPGLILVSLCRCVLALSNIASCEQRVAGFIFAQRFPPQLEALRTDVTTLQGFCTVSVAYLPRVSAEP